MPPAGSDWCPEFSQEQDFRGAWNNHKDVRPGFFPTAAGPRRTPTESLHEHSAVAGCHQEGAGRHGTKKGITGWHDMRKEDLIEAAGESQPFRGRQEGRQARRQTAAARNTGSSAEEQVERSKYDVGVPTKIFRQGAQAPADRLRQGSHRRHGPRPLLATCLLGADPPRASSEPKRPWARNGTAPNRSSAFWTSPHTTPPAPPNRSSATSTSTAAAITGTSRSATRPSRSASTSAISPSAAGSTSWPAPTSSRTPHAGSQRPDRRELVRPRLRKKADRIYAMSGGFDPDRQQPETEATLGGTPSPADGLAAVTSFGSGAFSPGKTASSSSTSMPN